jgi:hypothetical protein
MGLRASEVAQGWGARTTSGKCGKQAETPTLSPSGRSEWGSGTQGLTPYCAPLPRSASVGPRSGVAGGARGALALLACPLSISRRWVA